jgi:Fe-S cluster assembly protein SufD
MASALLESLLDGPDPVAGTAMAEPRSAARARLAREGLPGARDEAWKYTSLRALGQRRFTQGDCGALARAVDARRCGIPGVEGPRLVFVNGVFRADLSELPVQAGLSIVRLGGQPAAFDAALHAASAPEAGEDAFALLNTALAVDGVLLRVAAGTRVERPVQFVFAGAPAESDVAWHLRLRIEMGESSVLEVIEQHVDAEMNAHLANRVLDAKIAPGAQLDLLQLQDAAAEASVMRASRFVLGEGALLSLHAVETGARLARHALAVDLRGRGARFVARGVFALQGRQHADTQLAVVHAARDTTSDVAWRGVADQRARGVFRGAITVAAGADGADAQLSSRNLLLSADAEIDTQPVLEIHADEVKAAHGATVGQLDERALFYLRSRGLPLAEARRLLVAAFCGAVLADLAPAQRTAADALLATRVPAGEGTA